MCCVLVDRISRISLGHPHSSILAVKKHPREGRLLVEGYLLIEYILKRAII